MTWGLFSYPDANFKRQPMSIRNMRPSPPFLLRTVVMLTYAGFGLCFVIGWILTEISKGQVKLFFYHQLWRIKKRPSCSGVYNYTTCDLWSCAYHGWIEQNLERRRNH